MCTLSAYGVINIIMVMLKANANCNCSCVTVLYRTRQPSLVYWSSSSQTFDAISLIWLFPVTWCLEACSGLTGLTGQWCSFHNMPNVQMIRGPRCASEVLLPAGRSNDYI